MFDGVINIDINCVQMRDTRGFKKIWYMMDW